jgi:hypothetical protein
LGESDSSLHPTDSTQVIQRQSHGARPWNIIRNNNTVAG